MASVILGHGAFHWQLNYVIEQQQQQRKTLFQAFVDAASLKTWLVSSNFGWLTTNKTPASEACLIYVAQRLRDRLNRASGKNKFGKNNWKNELAPIFPVHQENN